MVCLTPAKCEGFEVREVNDPARAVTAAGVFRPDFILLDAEMPGLGGGDAAGRLRTVPNRKKMPVVFLTGLPTAGEAARPLSSEGLRILAKLVKIAKLVECVARMPGALTWTITSPHQVPDHPNPPWNEKSLAPE